MGPVLLNPTDTTALADFWVERLLAAPRVRLADLDAVTMPPTGQVGAYLWVVTRGPQVSTRGQISWSSTNAQVG